MPLRTVTHASLTALGDPPGSPHRGSTMWCKHPICDCLRPSVSGSESRCREPNDQAPRLASVRDRWREKAGSHTSSRTHASIQTRSRPTQLLALEQPRTDLNRLAIRAKHACITHACKLRDQPSRDRNEKSNPSQLVAVHDFVKITLKSSSMKSTNPSIRSRYEIIHNEITWSDFSLKSAADNSIGRH